MTEATMETTRPSAWRKMLGNTGVMIGGPLLATEPGMAVTLGPIVFVVVVVVLQQYLSTGTGTA